MFLGKNHKINFSYTSYSYSGNGVYGGHRCEYVEDDYYYYAYDSGTNGVMNSIIFIDLKTEPANIYYAQSHDGNDYVEKHISLELDDGRKLSYVQDDAFGDCAAYLYDAARDVMMAKRDNSITIDLWQTDGWEWFEQTPTLNYSIKTDKVMEVAVDPLTGEAPYLYQDAERTVDLVKRMHGDYENRNVLVSVNVAYADAQSNTYEIWKPRSEK